MKKILLVLFTIMIILTSCSAKKEEEKPDEPEREIAGYYPTQYLRGIGNTTLDNLANKKIALSDGYGSEYNEFIKKELSEYGVSEDNYVYCYAYEVIPSLILDKSIDAFVVNSNNEDLISDYRTDYNKNDYPILKEINMPIYADEVSDTDWSEYWGFNHTTTILISGIDERVEPDTIAGVRADVLMVLMVDPLHNHILTISFPRDSYVKSHNHGYSDKANHLVQNGIEDLKQSIGDVLGRDIHYYVQVSFSSFIDMINTMGGVRVDVPYNMTLDQDSYRNVANPVSVDKGEQILYGEYALALARNRKYSGLVGGDFGRIRNQTLIVNSIIKKVTNNPDILDWAKVLLKYSKLTYTDIPYANMEVFIALAKVLSEEGYTIDNYFVECFDGNVGGAYVGYMSDKSVAIAKGKAQLVVKGKIDENNPYYEEIMTGYTTKGAGTISDGGFIGDEYDLREIYK